MTQPKRVRAPVLPAVDLPAPFTPIVAAGMRAFSEGRASEHQQREVFDWLLKHAAGIGTQSYRADPYATAFAEGRRFVALQMMALLEVKSSRPIMDQQQGS